MAESEPTRALAPVHSMPRPAEWEVLRESSYLVAKTAFALQWSHRPENIMAAMLMGRELGIGPMAAVLNVHVIDGRPSASAELQLALIRRAGHKVNVVKWNGETCILKGVRSDGGDEAEVEFSLEDAKAAELYPKKDNWRKYPKAMMWARAVSMLGTALFGDVVLGLKTADELGVETEEDGQTFAGDPNVPEDFARAPQRPAPGRPAAASEPIEGTATEVPGGETTAPSATVSTPAEEGPAEPKGRSDQAGTLPVARNVVAHSATAPPAPPEGTAPEVQRGEIDGATTTITRHVPAPARQAALPGAKILTDADGDHYFVPAGLTDDAAIPLPPYPDRTCSKCVEEEKAAEGADSEWKGWADKGEARWMCKNGHLARKPRNWSANDAVPPRSEEPGPAEPPPVPPVEAAAAPSAPPAAATESPSPTAAPPSSASVEAAFGPPPAPAPSVGAEDMEWRRAYVLSCAAALKRTQFNEANSQRAPEAQLQMPAEEDLKRSGTAALGMLLTQLYAPDTTLASLSLDQLDQVTNQLVDWIRQHGGEVPSDR